MVIHPKSSTPSSCTSTSTAAGAANEAVIPLKAKNLWFDAKSDAYYCQLSVPVDLLEAGVKKKLRKKLIGRLNETSDDELRTRCAQAADVFRAEFERERASKAKANEASTPATDSAPPVALVSFPLTEELCVRAAATWASGEAADFERKLATCREGATPDARSSARAVLVEEASCSLQAAMDAQADGCTLLATQARTDLETRFRVRLGDERSSLNELAQALNAERVAFLERAIDVARGRISNKQLAPPHGDQLPLVELWGTDLDTALDHWVVKGDNVGDPRRARTLDKYGQIIRTFRPILGRRPLEATTSTDVHVFIAALRSESNNMGATIAGKLAILSSLMQPFDKRNVVCELIDDARRALDATSAERLTFTPHQLATLVHGIAGDPTLPSSHSQIVVLLALTGARLEEICQLRGSDIRKERGLEGEDFWLIQIASSNATGLGDAKVKTRQSNRRLPVLCGVLPELDAFLSSCSGAGTRLFPALQPDRYGTLSAAPSKLLNARIDELLGKDKRIVLQGLRATAANTMRSADVDYAQRLRFLGHTENSVHTRHYEAASQLDAYDLMPAARKLADFFRKSLALCPTERPSSQHGKRHGELDSTNCLGERAERNGSVVPPNGLTDVPGQGVVNVLGDATLPTEGLECVTEAVEHQSLVADSAAVAMSKEAREDLAKIASPTTVVVRLQGGEDPLLPACLQRVDVLDEACLHDSRMERDEAPRGDRLHPLLNAVANLQVPAMLAVVEHVGQPQLTELLQPTARDVGEHRDPSERVLATAFGPKAVGINPRAEDSLKVRLGEAQSLDSLDLGPRDFHATCDVGRQVARIEGALQHRVHKGELFRDGCPGVASFQKVVPERRDVRANELPGGLSDDGFEVPGKAFEFLDSAGRPVRVQAPPIPKKRQHVRTVPGGLRVPTRLLLGDRRRQARDSDSVRRNVIDRSAGEALVMRQ